MARKGDTGSYSLGNIECRLFVDNCKELGLNNPTLKTILKGRPTWSKGLTFDNEQRLVEGRIKHVRKEGGGSGGT